jgi:L-methionine (R)-S-oxide reductase
MTVNYELLEKQFAALADGEEDRLALSTNFVALLYAEIPDINWLGLYILRGSELVLGPFQGLPACTRIPLGRGVCGTAVEKMATLRIDDVHAFEGHIACDPASRSELVVPLISDDKVFAVLDIDSPDRARFTPEDQAGAERLCNGFVRILKSQQSRLDEFI